MTLKVILERVFEIVFDQYINLRVVFFSGNIKNRSYWPKKISLLIFFAAYLVTNVFSMKLWQSSALFDFVHLLGTLMMVYEKRKKFAKFKVFQKLCEIFDIFEILYKYSLFQIE